MNNDNAKNNGLIPCQPVTSGMQYMEVKTDIMHPIISTGDLIEVDMSVNHVECEGVYILLLCGAPTLRRISFAGLTGTGHAVLSCDNPVIQYRETISMNRLYELKAIGRVKRIWKDQTRQATETQFQHRHH